MFLSDRRESAYPFAQTSGVARLAGSGNLGRTPKVPPAPATSAGVGMWFEAVPSASGNEVSGHPARTGNRGVRPSATNRARLRAERRGEARP